MASKFSNFDLFRKIPRDLTKGTAPGAVLSIAALLLMALLVIFELAAYLAGRVDSAVIIDDNTEPGIPLSFKVSLLEIPCQFASVDVYDFLGQTRLDVQSNVFKSRIAGSAGEVYLGSYSAVTAPIAHEQDGRHDGAPEVSKELVEGTFPQVLRDRGSRYTFVNFFAAWCIHCQRLAPTWEAFAQQMLHSGMDVAIYRVDCVNHEELCREQNIMGYPTLRMFTSGLPLKDDYHGHRTVDALMEYVEAETGQHARAAQKATLQPRAKEGCTVTGQLAVNRVPGSIRLHAKSDNHDFEPQNTNVSHRIHHLSFGDPVRNSVLRRVPKKLIPNIAPLDGRMFINPSPAGFLSHDHYLKVVSTHYKMGGWFGSGREVTGYQMTVSSHMYHLEDGSVPEVKISYDLSPTAILISDRGAKRWYEFLTSLCAIVGGVYTVIGLMDSALYAALKKRAKSSQGKLM